MPSIQINPYYFIEIGQLPFPLLMARIFFDGGWVLALIVMVQGFWVLWIQSRNAKFASTLSYCFLAIDVPKLNEQTPKAVEQIFSHLSAAYSGFDTRDKYWYGKFQPTFSFELVSIGGYVQFIVHCQKKFRDLIEASVYAQYPDAEIIEIADYADKVPTVYPDPEWDLFGTEYVLKKPSAYPIRTYPEFEHNIAEVPFSDPMSPVLEAMASLKHGEQLWMQILLTPNDDKWREESEAVINKFTGKKTAPKKSMLEEWLWLPIGVFNQLVDGLLSSGGDAPKKEEDNKMLKLTPGEKNVLEAVQQKASKIGYNTKLRIIYTGRRDVFNKGRMTSLKGAFSQFGALNMNGFKGYGPVTPKGDYFWQRWSAPAKTMRILRNYRNRSNKGAPQFVLNIEELATIYHFPMLQVKAPLVKKTEAKRGEPPVSLPTKETSGRSPFQRVIAKPKEEKPPVPVEKPDDFEEGGVPGHLPLG
jgi:hypothetical protein